MSFIAEFAKSAKARPKKIALITDKSQLTYEDMLGLIHALDVGLAARAVRLGQTIVLATDRAEFCIAFGFLLSLRGWTLIFASAEAAVASGLNFDRVVCTEPTSAVAPDKQIVLDAAWFAALGTVTAPDYSGHSGPGGAFVFQSSGTTGRPKFIKTSAAVRLEETRHYMPAGGYESRRLLITYKPTSGYCLANFLAALIGGGSVISLGDDREKLLAYLDLYRADMLSTTPAIAQLMLRLPNAAQYLSGLRDVRFGGALASPALLRAFAAICPARLHVGYGAAEIGSCFRGVVDPAEELAPGYIGEFFRGDLEIAFFDAAYELLPEACEGIVGFRPAEGAPRREYLFSESEGAAGFRKGYFFPGDIMRREGTHYFLVGRLKNIVNFSGNKYALEAIQEVLEAGFPGAVIVPFAGTGESGLESVQVIYSAGRALSCGELSAVLALRFRGLKVSRAVKIEAIPLTGSGKIDIQALQAQLGEG
jgi:non-ribosomal peptide synthetase component E (peptide arylation enzyme)